MENTATPGIIYTSESRANEVADMLNARRGHPRARAIETEEGWSVLASYEFGVSGPTDDDAALRAALDLIKRHIEPEDTERNRDLHNAIQGIVTVGRRHGLLLEHGGR